MRIWWTAVFVASTAFADPKPPPKPDLVVRWETGERSRDMSLTITTIELTGTKLHYTQKHLGRGYDSAAKPIELDATVKDLKKVTTALAALDKLRPRPVKRGGDPTAYDLRSGCILRGAVERCAEASGSQRDPDDLAAIAAVRDALLDGVKLP